MLRPRLSILRGMETRAGCGALRRMTEALSGFVERQSLVTYGLPTG